MPNFLRLTACLSVRTATSNRFDLNRFGRIHIAISIGKLVSIGRMPRRSRQSGRGIGWHRQYRLYQSFTTIATAIIMMVKISSRRGMTLP